MAALSYAGNPDVEDELLGSAKAPRSIGTVPTIMTCKTINATSAANPCGTRPGMTLVGDDAYSCAAAVLADWGVAGIDTRKMAGRSALPAHAASPPC